MFGPEVHAVRRDLSSSVAKCVVPGGWTKHTRWRMSDCTAGHRTTELGTLGDLRQDVRLTTKRLLSEVRTPKHHDVHSGMGEGAVLNPQWLQIPVPSAAQLINLSCILMVSRQRMKSPRAPPRGFLLVRRGRQIYKSYAAHPRGHDDLYVLMIRQLLDTDDWLPMKSLKRSCLLLIDRLTL